MAEELRQAADRYRRIDRALSHIRDNGPDVPIDLASPDLDHIFEQAHAYNLDLDRFRDVLTRGKWIVSRPVFVGELASALDRAALTLRGRYGEADVIRDWMTQSEGSVHVLDSQLRPLPPGVVGELCIGGAGVGRGYIGQAALTAERFVPDPFDAGGRLYRTGDLARYKPDGELEFLGRSDRQVKVRGMRVELDEIEANLTAHPLVNAASVVVSGSGHDARLVAYVASAATAEALRAHLGRRLPKEMVPAAFVQIDGSARRYGRILRCLAHLLPVSRRRRYVAEVMGDLGTCRGRWERTNYLIRAVIGLPGLAWMLHRDNRRGRA